MNFATECVRCGKCLAVCPLYGVDPVEPLSPRGKMAMAEKVLAGELDLTDRLATHFYRCLLCGACQEICPRETPTIDLMLDVRRRLAGERKVEPIIRLFMAAARRSPKTKDRVIAGMRILRPLLFNRLPENSGFVPRLAGKLGIPDQVLPGFPNRSLLSILGTVVPPALKKGTVGVFAGCVINHLLPDIGLALNENLRRAGLMTVFPAGQECCGLMFWGEGRTDRARTLAKANAELFAGLSLEALVVPCASCLAAFRKVYPELLADDPRLSEAWGKLLPNILSFSELALRQGISPDPVDKESTVTYHDPCHLAHHLGLREEPRRFLKSIPGVRIKEMSAPDRCCGAGGLFGVENPDLASAVGDAKADDILNTGADMVVTSCPGCILQIRGKLILRGKTLPVLHPAQVMAMPFCSRPERSGGMHEYSLSSTAATSCGGGKIGEK